jgi:HK97 family phage prohead protease
MDIKSLCVEVKDQAKGLVSAVFSTFDTIDSDGDVTKAGAFSDGAEVVISAYGHESWKGRLPVGKGVIRAGANDAVLDGQFFMETTAGRETFEVVKQLGSLGQWSYGYDAVKYSFGEHDAMRVRFLEELKVHEVSPVLVGAGVNTRTLSAKSHQTFADEGGAVLAALTQFGIRAADVMAMRAEKGKGLSSDSTELLERVEAELKKLGELLQVPAPPNPKDDTATTEWLRMVARNVA